MGGGPKLVGFFGYPPSGAGQNPVAKEAWACFGPDFRSVWVSGFFRRPQENQACSDAADAGLGVSADAADAGRMLLMLVVSWPRWCVLL